MVMPNEYQFIPNLVLCFFECHSAVQLFQVLVLSAREPYCYFVQLSAHTSFLGYCRAVMICPIVHWSQRSTFTHALDRGSIIEITSTTHINSYTVFLLFLYVGQLVLCNQRLCFLLQPQSDQMFGPRLTMWHSVIEYYMIIYYVIKETFACLFMLVGHHNWR